MAELVDKFKPIMVDPDNLLLDPNNPRYQGDFPDFVFVPYEQIGRQEHQARALYRLYSEKFRVKELAESIAQVGYLPIDRLVVTRYDSHKFLVIEGNRRLAALKLVLEGKVPFKKGDPSALHKLPALLLDEPFESASIDQWLIQGTRHIGGVKEWGAYQKAKALRILISERGLAPPEASDALGLSKQDVNRSVRSLSAYQAIQEHEVFGRQIRPDNFSTLDEMIKIPAVRHYFGWSNRKMQFVDSQKRDFFLTLILGDPERDTPPKIKGAIQIREIPRILSHPEARLSLEDLSQPFERAIYLSTELDLRAGTSGLISSLETLAQRLARFPASKFSPAELSILSRIRDKLDDILKQAR